MSAEPRRRRSSGSIFRARVSAAPNSPQLRADAPADPLRRVAAYRYELPPEAIAKVPAEPADSARLLVLEDDAPALHERFVAFPKLLRAGDVLVVNETRVVRARLRGTRRPGGGAAEVLLLRPAGGGPFDLAARSWEALVRPGRSLGPTATVQFGTDATLVVDAVLADGRRVVTFPSGVDLETLLERFGEVPLPPYVGAGDERRAARYQTIFARVPGSVAAPTASLHFTPRVLAEIEARGVRIVPLVLDVGLGTFKPMAGDSIDDHPMHAERYAIPQETAQAVDAAKREGRRVIVAGTTALRALEASAAKWGRVVSGSDETSLFISPGFSFRVADGLLTNFHLPASTLLVLAAAYGGYDRVIAAYREALAAGYRFFSFGDAMYLTPGIPAPAGAVEPSA